jgi:hypothetical protein
VRLHALRVRLAADDKGAKQVGLEHGAEAVGRDLRRRRDELAAAVVHEVVEPAKLAECGRHRRGHLRLLLDVCRRVVHAADARAVGAQLADRALELDGRARDDGHVAAETEELARDRQPQAGPAARHERSLSRKQPRAEDAPGPVIVAGGLHRGSYVFSVT